MREILFRGKRVDNGEWVEQYSKTYANKYGRWSLDFDGMAKKTVTKQNLNSGVAPLSIEMQKAIKFDQSHIKDVQTEDSEYVDATDQQVIEDRKPTLTDEEVAGAINDGLTLDQMKDNYNLTEGQIKLFE